MALDEIDQVVRRVTRRQRHSLRARATFHGGLIAFQRRTNRLPRIGIPPEDDRKHSVKVTEYFNKVSGPNAQSPLNPRWKYTHRRLSEGYEEVSRRQAQRKADQMRRKFRQSNGIDPTPERRVDFTPREKFFVDCIKYELFLLENLEPGTRDEKHGHLHNRIAAQLQDTKFKFQDKHGWQPSTRLLVECKYLLKVLQFRVVGDWKPEARPQPRLDFRFVRNSVGFEVKVKLDEEGR